MTKKPVSVLAMAATLALLGALVPLVSCFSPVVGAECKGGLVECNGTCVAPDSDRLNCGGCGLVCDGQCVAGECKGTRAVAPRPPCDIGLRECGDSCVDTSTSEQHCGQCGQRCEGGDVCSAGECKSVCEQPAMACGAECVQLDRDPHNCGICGRTCNSAICEAGECQDRVPGHVVVIGHDYVQSVPAMNLLLGNAVLFLGRDRPVKVLAFEGDAAQASVEGTRNAIEMVARQSQVNWHHEMVDADTLTERLAQADALIIHAQERSSDARLNQLGGRWEVALKSFAQNGGVIVLLDGPSSHGGTHQILQRAGLFEAVRRVVLNPDEELRLKDPTDAVAAAVPQSYRSPRAPVRFEANQGNVVVEDSQRQPVVLHRSVE